MTEADARAQIDCLVAEKLWGELLLLLMDKTPDYCPDTLRALNTVSHIFGQESLERLRPK